MLETKKPDHPKMLFWKKQDWKKLREEFFSETLEDGSYKYKTAKEFMRDKFADTKERQWAGMAVGRRLPVYMPWEGNWELERYQERWKEDQGVAVVAKAIEKELDAATVAYATAPMFVDYMGRIKDMQQQVDQEFKGRLFLDNLSPLENGKRARAYVSLTGTLQNMMTAAILGAQEATGGRKMMVLGMMERYLKKAEARHAGSTTPEFAAVEEFCSRFALFARERAQLFPQKPPEIEEAFQAAEAGKTITVEEETADERVTVEK